jgi:hypothetical protein
MKEKIMQLNKNMIVIFMLMTSLSFSQQKTNTDFWNNVRFGGGLGLNFGNGFSSITIAPSAIYEFNNTVALGVGLNATFNNQKSVSKSTILGGSVIGLFNVIRELQLSAEFEQLNVDRNFNINLNIEDENYWVPALFIGAGYRSGNVTFGIRYDVLYNEEQSIYLDPWMPFVRFFF